MDFLYDFSNKYFPFFLFILTIFIILFYKYRKNRRARIILISLIIVILAVFVFHAILEFHAGTIESPIIKCFIKDGHNYCAAANC